MEKSIHILVEPPFPRIPNRRFVVVAWLITAITFVIYGTIRTGADWNFFESRGSDVLISHCRSVVPISVSEFHQRQQTLAETLHDLNASAYIVEPSASSLYYANISSSSWHLSERPLLFIISPRLSEDGTIRAESSILTPAFEATRAKQLPVAATNVSYPEWPEDVSPYEVAVRTLSAGSKIFVDGSVRHFIVDGLQSATSRDQVLIAPVEIRQLRERKSAAELEIMKCANEVTLLAIRAVRDKLRVGIRESEARSLMDNTLATAGLKDTFSLVLFGENAALPHGSGTDRELSEGDFALIDCGGSLHGYQSDVTRTFLLRNSAPSTDNLALWYIVRAAQSRALRAAHAGVLTGDVDEAAREVIDAAGYAKHFTHRLGHGIGLETHESPYLRGASNDIIQVGHTFSDEPGIYIEGQVGIRLEDCFYIDEDGKPVYLTERVGGQAVSPWAP